MYVEGMKVMISEQGHDKHGTDQANPPLLVGVCTGYQHGSDDGWFGVEWPNGASNAYEEGDLVVVEDAP